MSFLKKILNKFNGLHYRQEYLCLAGEPYPEPLHLYLVKNKYITKDITNHHLFVGYNPLILAFSSSWTNELTDKLQLIFSQHALEENVLYFKKDALASLNLKIIKKQPAEDLNIFYYEGIKGHHFFLSGFYQFIGSIINKLYNKKTGNVFLHDNLYKQVQIAYAIPRIISLISIEDKGKFNLFPTDLHGQPGANHYIISLRSAGKACKQVEAAGKLVISQMKSDTYKTVYALGKNHMQDLRPKENFPFGNDLSEKFKLPLPAHFISYNELILTDSFVHGIHTIMLFTIVNHHSLQPRSAVLAHIHNSYATWRYKNKLPGNYLLR